MHNKKQQRQKDGILDQKWMTYLLAFLLIVLIGVLVVSLKYQDEMINFLRDLFTWE